MKRLPYIDEHATAVDADRAATWSALTQVVSVPIGFVLEEAREPERYSLKGRHWFSIYRLVFVLTEAGPGHTTLAAETWAAFPGLKGRVYRALVIGSGAHRVLVRQMLKRIARHAVSEPTAAR